MTHILYNPLADNRSGEANAKKISSIISGDELDFIDVTALDINDFLKKTPQQERIIISGGDGTIHYLINSLGGIVPERSIYYYPAGSGNDFKTDIRETNNEDIILLNPYIKDLPTVRVKEKELLFLNGIGYGIDGYCCEEGDRQRSLSDRPINYTAIAIKGLLFKFSPRNAEITVDGTKHTYDHVWLAAAMNGRFYGGGMMVAPGQDRLNQNRLVTLVVMHCPSKLKTLMAFPSIFKGEHVRHTKIVEVLTGHEITVSFDLPTPLQVDGETFSGVTTYSVRSADAGSSAEIKSAETAMQ